MLQIIFDFIDYFTAFRRWFWLFVIALFVYIFHPSHSSIVKRLLLCIRFLIFIIINLIIIELNNRCLMDLEFPTSFTFFYFLQVISLLFFLFLPSFLFLAFPCEASNSTNWLHCLTSYCVEIRCCSSMAALMTWARYIQWSTIRLLQMCLIL